MRRFFRLLFCCFLCFHAAAVLLAHLPRNSALEPKVSAVIAPYLDFTGTWQSWNMFYTIPHFHHFDLELKATLPDGQVKSFGPLLPGLRPHDGYIRLTLFFNNILELGSYQLPKYLKRACAELSELDPNIIRLSLVTHISELRTLEEIASDGVIANEITEVRYTADCGEEYYR